LLAVRAALSSTMRVAAAVLGLLACSLSASAVRDVPKGYCHDCEVTCFEDCVLKFDREIIVPDLTDTKRLSRADTKVEAHMKKKLAGVVLSQNGATPTENVSKNVTALVDAYGSCLKQDHCPCKHDAKKQAPSFLAAAGSKRKCSVSQRPCAVGCVDKLVTVSPSPALVQKSLVKPGPKDPDDAAIPWSVNIHPVKINTFATGRQNLEQCFKSCLAATCGCDDAPGMDAIEDMNSAIKANDAAKDPVDDSAPMWQYKLADIVDCGKGMQGKKITKGLYVNLAGGQDWHEVCSDDFFEAMGTPGDIGKKNCGNSKALLAGCLWDENKGKCVYGLKKQLLCQSRYKDDDKL